MANKKIRSFGIFLILGLTALLSLAYCSATPFFAATPTPGPRGKPIPLEAQAGHTDAIVLLGIFIFALIVIPILLRYRDAKNS